MGGLEATRKIQEFNGVISVVALTANVFVQGKLAFMQTFADKSSIILV